MVGAVAASKRAGTPWWVYLLVAVLGAVSWEIVSSSAPYIRRLLSQRA